MEIITVDFVTISQFNKHPWYCEMFPMVIFVTMKTCLLRNMQLFPL